MDWGGGIFWNIFRGVYGRYYLEGLYSESRSFIYCSLTTVHTALLRPRKWFKCRWYHSQALWVVQPNVNCFCGFFVSPCGSRWWQNLCIYMSSSFSFLNLHGRRQRIYSCWLSWLTVSCKLSAENGEYTGRALRRVFGITVAIPAQPTPKPDAVPVIDHKLSFALLTRVRNTRAEH